MYVFKIVTPVQGRFTSSGQVAWHHNSRVTSRLLESSPGSVEEPASDELGQDEVNEIETRLAEHALQVIADDPKLGEFQV